MKPDRRVEYLIVGAGPAGLCAVAKLIDLKINPQAILWVDPQFDLGDFGGALSVGSSVPGNTKISSYLTVVSAINQIMSAVNLPPTTGGNMLALDPNKACSLSIASEPFRRLTENLLSVVQSIQGQVTQLEEKLDNVLALITTNSGESRRVIASHVILATGSVAKTLDLNLETDKIILDCNIAFIESELNNFLQSHRGVDHVAVIGSSHSAALAVMQLLKAGCTVSHFMVGDYRYAEYKISSNGYPYTKYDNTGLKGEVASFTQGLTHENYFKFRGNNKDEVSALVKQHQDKFTHVVVAIGYQPANTLTINHKTLAEFTYDAQSLKIDTLTRVSGLGIAFPQKVQGVEGELEFSVGIGKFWTTVNQKAVYGVWMQNRMIPSHLTQLSYFGEEERDAVSSISMRPDSRH